ncbi:transcriptional regulator [Levilactobacillus spicheri DSM 15429]|uniref:Transcriptional regulator n=2 Tax=Levilactobacillus spicheri TaxID=216463 RepID=A0A0R1QTH3_9LACO|nr:transcriptional regulator [Levilactobacillus spicheri DSM 15429]
MGTMAEQDDLNKVMAIYGLVTHCYNQPLADLDLNLPQCQVIGYVAVEHLSVAQVAQKLGFSATRTSNLVVSLCRRGYLDQHVAPDDRRRRYLALTARGQAQLLIIRRQLPTILHQALARLERAAQG